MISVVVATYNGEKYIREQLESILKQSRKPDEVLIFDDGSTDKSVNICREFIQSNILENWKVIENQENLGYIDNFFRGIQMVHGDLVVLCDQDDIWKSERLEIMEQVMIQHKEILSLTTTFSRIDEKGKVLTKHVKHPHRKKGGLKQISVDDFFKFHTYLGMSMVIQKKLFESVMTQNPYKITHDIVLNMYAVANEGLFHLDQVLTDRRSYISSTSNNRIRTEINTKFGGNAKLQYLNRKLKLLECQQYNINNKFFNDRMEKYRIFYQKRYETILKNSIFRWMLNIRYLPYYDGLKEYIGDLKFTLKGCKSTHQNQLD